VLVAWVEFWSREERGKKRVSGITIGNGQAVSGRMDYKSSSFTGCSEEAFW
jgi:hypothetical protein